MVISIQVSGGIVCLHFKSAFSQSSSIPMTPNLNLNSKALSWAPDPYVKKFLNTFIWTYSRISPKLSMPQTEVFFLLSNLPYSLCWTDRGDTFPLVAQVRKLNVIFVISLPFTTFLITQQVLSVIPPKWLLNLSTFNCQLWHKVLKYPGWSSIAVLTSFQTILDNATREIFLKLKCDTISYSELLNGSLLFPWEKVKRFLLWHIRLFIIYTTPFSPVSLVIPMTTP